MYIIFGHVRFTYLVPAIGEYIGSWTMLARIHGKGAAFLMPPNARSSRIKYKVTQMMKWH